MYKFISQVNIKQKVFLGISAIFVIYSLFLSINHLTTGILNDIYGLLIGWMVAIAGLICLKKIPFWKNEKNISKGLFWCGLGLICWGVGGTIWIYYSVFKGIILAYPSLADIFYLPSVLFYSVGVVYFTRGSGYNLKFKDRKSLWFSTIVTVIITVVSFFIMTTIIRGGEIYNPENSVLANILNIIYPCIDFVGLIIALFISELTIRDFKSMNGIYLFFLAFGLMMMFVSDSFLTYFINNGLYYNGGFTEFLYMISTSILIFGLMGFCDNKARKESSILC